MVDLVKWCLFTLYYLGRFFGVLNFEIDLKTGRSRITKRATISGAIANLVLLFIVCFHMDRTRFITQGWSNVNSLQDTLLIVMSIVRITCVSLSLASRWSQRRTFMRLYNSIYRLYQSNPDIFRFCRKSIVSKCICAAMSQALLVVMILNLTKSHVNFAMTFSIWSVLSLSSTIHVIIGQYFVAMAIIRGSYNLLIKKLRSVLAETQSLIPNRRGVFMTKCCHLADILEEIDRTQSHLQALTERLSRTYRLQIICMVITYYLNLVGNFYFFFTVKKYKLMTANWPILTLVGGIAYATFYYLDCWLNAFNVFYLIDSHYEMVTLLNERTLFPPGLDQRLETVLESFVLNLARNPFKLSFFGLFGIDRMKAFAMANSILTHSVLLIQCDVEHF